MTQPPNNQFPGDPNQPYGQPTPGQPYGQQTPGGQPAGQPTPGQAPGPQQPGQPYGGGDQPYGATDPNFNQAPQGVFDEKPKGGGVKKILSTIVTVAIIAVGGYFLWDRFAGDMALEPGKCITVKGDNNDDVDHKEIDCGDADTYSYVVAEVFDGTGDCGDSLEYTTTSSRRGSTRTTKTTCLIPNFTADKCYKIVDDSVLSYEVAACEGADFKITKVEDSATGSCEAPAEAFPFERAKKTFCVENLA